MNHGGSLVDRPRTYYNIDGVGELGIGVMLLGFASLQWMQVHTPSTSLWNQMYTVFIAGGVIALGIHYGSKAIKQRVTYPRTGFVAYRRQDTLWRPLLVAFGCAVLASLGVVAVQSGWSPRTLVSIFGLVLAVSYVNGIDRTVRWKWMVAFALALGSLVIAFFPAPWLSALVGDSWLAHRFPASVVGAILLSMALYGAIYLISGGISFWLYLRSTQAAAEDLQ